MQSKILELIHEKKWKEVQEEIKDLNAVNIAESFEDLDNNDVLILFRILPKDLAADVFSYLSREDQMVIVTSFADKEIEHILKELRFDDMVDFLEEVPANLVRKILKNTTPEKRELINQFLKYPENSAGSLMTIEYVRLKKSSTVKDALDYIKKTGMNKETVYTCYVTNAKRKLEGIVPLRKLVTSELDTTIGEIMYTDVIRVHTHDDQEEVAHVFKKYDFIALPVVDKEDRLVGIITIDDIIDVIEQESTEDFQIMAGMQPSENEYLKTSVFTLSKHRITWLLILMISATFTGRIIQHYEDVLQSVVILTSFIPMLMDTGGNAGSQSSTLVIRGMALGEINSHDYWKVFSKELQVSILVGLMLSSVNFLRVFYLQKVGLNISLVVSAALFLTVVLAKIVGGLLPLGAKRLKMDPAIMASPLITTVVDAASLMVYFLLATKFLGI